jgi:hypothetical protein
MFRFTIREVIVVTVICAMALQWWLERRSYSFNAQSQSDRLELLRYERDTAERARNEYWKMLVDGGIVHSDMPPP